MGNNRRLYRSDDAVFAGVCGGVAEYFEIDVTLIRILTVILCLAGFGFPIIIYIVAMIIMPKRAGNYSAYIDVEPSPSQTPPASRAAYPSSSSASSRSVTGAGPTWTGSGAANATSGAAGPRPAEVGAASAGAGAAGAYAAGASAGAAAPGSAYTACNPQAFDVNIPPIPCIPDLGHRKLRTSVTLGILLVGTGFLALFATLSEIAIWKFWPAVLIMLGVIMLFTPGRRGWSLARAGSGILLATVGIVLLLWTLEFFAFGTFTRMASYLWPVLLVVIGLSIIGNATHKSIFKLFSSLLLSATLLFGIWAFGRMDVTIELGGQAVQVTSPTDGDLLSPYTSTDGK